MRYASEMAIVLLSVVGGLMLLALVFLLAKAQFKALAQESLSLSQERFLQLAQMQFEKAQDKQKNELEQRAQALAAPVQALGESLGKVDEHLRALERSRVQAYAQLGEQVRSLTEGQQLLRGETSNLVKALRQPVVRGRWGEMQLRRVVELAGMLEHCDFEVQATSDSGAHRPDMIVSLPGGKRIVVDAKTPLSAYLDALEAPDEDSKRARLHDHARQIRHHVAALSRKAYWEQFKPTPELVVLFLPGENFFSAALEADPSLFDIPPEQRIVIATPTTLIALLRAISYGWQQERIADNARLVSELGRDLAKRIADSFEHLQSVGKNLERSVQHYNRLVGSLEGRVMPQLRKFKDLGVISDDPPVLAQVELVPRQMDAFGD